MSIEGESPFVLPKKKKKLVCPILEHALDKYFDDVSVFKKSHRQERARMYRWAKTPLAKMKLDEITGVDIRAYQLWRLENEASNNTIRLELALLSHLYETARREWGHEKLINPVLAVRKLKPPKGRTRRLLDEEETSRLLSSCQTYGGPILFFVVIVAIETAMRRGELVSLRWEGISFEKRTAYLHDTKNGESRTVPLSKRAIEILKQYQEDRKSKYGQVFKVHPDTITERFLYCCRKAGIEGLRFHDLRHEATSRLFEKGLSTMEVSSITGHKTLTMLKRYTHLKASALALKLD